MYLLGGRGVALVAASILGWCNYDKVVHILLDFVCFFSYTNVNKLLLPVLKITLSKISIIEIVFL